MSPTSLRTRSSARIPYPHTATAQLLQATRTSTMVISTRRGRVSKMPSGAAIRGGRNDLTRSICCFGVYPSSYEIQGGSF